MYLLFCLTLSKYYNTINISIEILQNNFGRKIMRLIIKNKLVSLGEGSYVCDENGNKVFKVKGTWKIFSPTRKKKIFDMQGNLQYIVRNKFWHFVYDSVFVYNREKDKIAMLSNNRWDFKRKFVLKGYKDEITISGNLFQFPNIKMEINKNGKKIGTLTKDFNLFRDHYTLDVESDEDAGFLVALVIGVDNIYDKMRDSNNK